MSDEATVRADANGAYVYLKWTCVGSERWRQVLEDFKIVIPAPVRTFDGQTKSWRVQASWGRELGAFLATHFAEEVRWLNADGSPGAPPQDRHQKAGANGQGAGQYTKKTKGRRQRPPPASPPPPPCDAAWARAHLYVTADAPPCVVRASYRALAQERHPDHGGSHEEMLALNRAMERLMREPMQHEVS